MSPRALSPSHRSQIAPFLVMDVMNAAHRLEMDGQPVFHLEVGQPSTPAPALVQSEAARVLGSDTLGYSLAAGLPALRRRIAAYYAHTHQKEIDPETVFLTTGASGGFLLAFLACFDPGARVAVARPGYPCYRNILSALDLVPVELPLGPERDFRFSVEALQELETPPAGVVIASPANPTGTVLGASALRDVIAYCRAHGIVAIFDEIYHGLVYDGSNAATAAGNEGVLVINSFSKYFSMTGWRLGWMVVPPELCRTVEALAQNFTICAPTLSQRAALLAFDAEDELRAHVQRYGRNRQVLLDALGRAGVTRVAPAEGAFYVYADLSPWTRDTQQFCHQMLHDIRVAATSGVDFDPVEGGRYVRFSYCVDEESLATAAQRIEDYLCHKQKRL